MIQYQVKLKLKKKQEIELLRWLFHLYKVWNWAIRKIENDGNDKIFHRKNDFQNLLANHSRKLEVPSHSIQGILEMAWTSWQRCYKKVAKKPRLKGKRNRLNSIPFPDPIKYPTNNRIKLPKIGIVKCHKQEIPEGRIKCGRVVKRASGWYLCLFIDAMPKAIQAKNNRVIGIDPGFKTSLTTTDRELDKLIEKHKKKRFEEVKTRLAQAQRGRDKKLVSRLMERLKNRRKDDNHKLSRKLVEECKAIYFSKDSIQKIARKPKPQKKKNGRYKRSIRFGKSVQEAGHYQLRQMLSYKCNASGREYKEVESKYSTMTCSECGALTGPTGKAGLSVRSWRCIGCGTLHDRDRNAAVNTLRIGLGTSLERVA
jgi:transposase